MRDAIGPDECHVLVREAGFQGAPVAAIAADTFAEAAAALELVEVEWEQLGPFLDPDDAIAEGQAFQEPSRYERGDLERGLAEADVVVEAEYRTQTVLHNALETHQAVCAWEGGGLTVYASTQYIWGVRRRSRPGSASRPTRCGSCAATWAAASAPRTAPATPRSSPPSWHGGRAGRSAARSPAGRRTSPAGTGTRRSSAWWSAPAPTAP